MNKRDVAVFLILGVCCVMLLTWLGTGSLPAWSQSPASPLPTKDASRVQAPRPPGMGTSRVSPPPPMPTLEPSVPLLEGELWSSPWTWAAIGIVVFGGVALALTALLRRLGSIV